MSGLAARLEEFGGETLPAFGTPVGVVVNHSPDSAVRYDLAGTGPSSAPMPTPERP